MSGVFTSRRNLPNDYHVIDKIGNWRTHWIYANPTSLGIQDRLEGAQALTQTTTSYRSGGDYGRPLDNVQALLLENHRQNVRPYDTGHEFSSWKVKEILSHPHWEARASGGHYRAGPLLLEGHSATDYSRTFGGMDMGKGTFALKQTRPTKSAANLSQLLLELVVDLPQIPLKPFMKGWNKDPLRKISASEYLNIVFGWQPTVSDVLKICEAIVRSEEILNQYQRDSGKKVRRSFEFDEEHQILETKTIKNVELAGWMRRSSGAGSANLYPSDLSKSVGTLSFTRTISTKYWFKGAWSYKFLDPFEDGEFNITRYADAARKLLGVKLDIALLWELAPWSWLIDWFTNIGDIIDVNVAFGQDDLVLRYGYMMRTTRHRATSSHSGVTFISGPTGPISHQVEITEKKRWRSTPYGFGVNLEGLNPNQWAILAALGLTGGDKKLVWG